MELRSTWAYDAKNGLIFKTQHCHTLSIFAQPVKILPNKVKAEPLHLQKTQFCLGIS